ncbi:ImmA/IrrE family metallo-endopeptidase [Paenibacillus sp. FSL R5-0527]|uniref:ImmA/IrrE family metallo-endopeptidase n=1 Tax=Paenibacillus sp. FSL R5-0527 TaxID=2975321 RepID=UPI00097A2E84|nr:hypothetical protein BK140_16670 [Paenibacillus macerans]
MFRNYQMTELEKFQADLYARINIQHPWELEILEIADRLNIWIYFTKQGSKALELKEGLYSINIDKNLSPMQQRLDFFHELCHVLRHAGDQSVLPEMFTQVQEREAEQFVYYATLPFKMISELPIPVRLDQAVSFLSSEFRVPAQLAKQRLDQLKRRTFFGNLLVSSAKKNQVPEKREWSKMTHQLLIQLEYQLKH